MSDESPPKRPRTRADCEHGPRPCPWASCRHHLWGQLSRRAGDHSPRFVGQATPIEEMRETCALDVAARGPHSLSEIGEVLGISREMVRKIESSAIKKLRESPAAQVLMVQWGLEERRRGARAAQREESGEMKEAYKEPPKALGVKPRLSRLQDAIVGWARYLFAQGEAPTIEAIAEHLERDPRTVAVSIDRCRHSDYLWSEGRLVYVRGMELFDADMSVQTSEGRPKLVVVDGITPEHVAQAWGLTSDELEALRFLQKRQRKYAIYLLKMAKDAPADG